MFFDFKPIWDNFSGQALILLAIVALAIIIYGSLTQGVARTIGVVIGIIFLGVLILVLGDLEKIANWIKDKIFITGSIQSLLVIKNLHWWV